MEADEQALEIFLVDYLDVFARYRMDIGMNTECRKKCTPHKTVSSVQPKPTVAEPLERRLKCQTVSDANLRNPFSTTFFNVHKPTFAQ